MRIGNQKMTDHLLQIGFAVVGFVVWLVRLEGKINATEKSNVETQKDVDDLRARHESRDSEMISQLSEIRESLARLEGSLGIIKRKGE